MTTTMMLTEGQARRLAAVLRWCSKGSLPPQQGLPIHALLLSSGFTSHLILNNHLLNFYGSLGQPSLAHHLFDSMPDRNVVSWTCLMRAHLHNGNPARSLQVFGNMMTSSGDLVNEFALSTAVKVAGVMGRRENGVQVHAVGVKYGFDCSSSVVGNCLVDMYARCKAIEEGVKMFWSLPVVDLISWNVMIAGYVMSDRAGDALVLFKRMREEGDVPDEYTFSSIVKSCTRVGDVAKGEQIHGFLITSGFGLYTSNAVAGALVDLYVKCGCLSEAKSVFNRIEEKNVISWNALILGCAQEGSLPEAMTLFRSLREGRMEIDGFILSSLIGVFADFALVEQGRQMQAYAVKLRCGQDISVTNSLLDLYLKCGLTDQAEMLFSEMTTKNVVSWTVMITGFGKHGLGDEAVRLFYKMLAEGVEPDGVTYLAILSACSHSGLVEESRQLFSKLCADKQIKLQVEHYACMVDVLGRAGRLKEAKSLIDGMQLKTNIGIWQTLLSACQVHGDVEMGREVGEILMKMDINNPVNYVMMSNILLDKGQWEKGEEIREQAKIKNLKKVGGCSWVEVDKRIHYFYSGDEMHPLIDLISDVLKKMEYRMREELGYIYDVRFVLHDVEAESKEDSLRVHSEKLAIGLALVSGHLELEGGDIRIFKNLRICGDCHGFMKGLSKVLKKTILVRDANRFHKFQDGQCSCKDFW
ncbi:hypothetical protein MLD38_015214 [Melastoma candidum]|uniref:Uncharacterized protein n=1 Tax=Melastoma candidum TaxID=119954 RepID=A0ACB9RIG7_9MYRT|nr:hypothetical protein MLD38_015214 [Melastoma candidum]